jgi:hypothetical protein
MNRRFRGGLRLLQRRDNSARETALDSLRALLLSRTFSQRLFGIQRAVRRQLMKTDCQRRISVLSSTKR